LLFVFTAPVSFKDQGEFHHVTYLLDTPSRYQVL
jgi:hypothetical protein